MAASIVDTRLLQKPPRYTNLRAEWPLFKFTFKTYCGAVDESLLEILTNAESIAVPITMADISEEHRKLSRTVMYILVSCMQGSALQLAMNVESSNGLEAWRLLVRREEPQEGSTQVATLMSILRTTFQGGTSGLVDELEKLDGAVKRYETQYNDLVSDAILQSIMKWNCPEEIKAHVTLQTFASAKLLKERLSSYAVTRLVTETGAASSTTQPQQQPQPMDIGAFGGGRGKGKGQKGKSKDKGGKDSKGTGKGKDKSSGKEHGKNDKKRFDGNCNFCGKYGHKKTECWNRPAVGAVETTNQRQQPPGLAQSPPGSLGAIEPGTSWKEGPSGEWIF